MQTNNILTDDILIEVMKDAFQSIDFINRYRAITETHNDFDSLLRRMDKPSIQKVFKTLGYPVKLFSPGQDYIYLQQEQDITFHLDFQVSKGAVYCYLMLFYRDNKDRIPFPKAQLGFIAKYLLGNMQESITIPTFKDYEELFLILQAVFQIFEDFKGVFLARLREYQTKEN